MGSAIATIAVVVVIAALITFVTGMLPGRTRLGSTSAFLLPSTLAMIFWIAGSAWIFSPLCSDVDTCDSGGWLAFSLTAGMLVVLALLGGVVGVVLLRFFRN